MTNESWKPIIEPANLDFEISNLGRLRKIRKDDNGNIIQFKYYEPKVTEVNKYPRIVFNSNGIKTCKYYSELVSRAWLGEKPEGHELTYKDGNKLNLSIENLLYVPKEEHKKTYYQATYPNWIPVENREKPAYTEREKIIADDLEGEVWVECKYNPDYSISNLGRVKRNITFNAFPAGMILNSVTSTDGYKSILFSIKKDSINYRKGFRVHRLVVEHFFPEDQVKNLHTPGYVVNHIDGNKLNNCVSNLEVISSSQNSLHYHTTTIKVKSNKVFQSRNLPFTQEPNEEIKKINYGDRYFATSLGKILVKEKDGLLHQMRCSKTKQGYVLAKFSYKNVQTVKLAHTVVMETFVGPKPDDNVINHKDGNKSNNALSNLEYCTSKENARHAVDNSLRPRGSAHPKATLTEDIVKQIKDDYKTGNFTQEKLALKYNTTRSSISYITSGKTWKHVS